jgi:hypothetical protein
LLSAFLVAAGLLLGAVTSLAHHSVSAEFDPNKPIEFTGTVKVVEWVNPHLYTQVEVKQPDGKVTVYRVEGGAPNGLYRNGWRKDSLKPGTVIAFKGTRAKNPESMNVNGRMTMPDGKVAWQGDGPDR